ncbi:MAG: hypothetical protein GKS00_02095 [Alphaproteobacteria bacterium]|nr:hypothetical protein [Alphaproteobacteria bacterium]
MTVPPVHILAFGGGVDSTALLAIDLDRRAARAALRIPAWRLDDAFPPLDAVVFADPGAEFPATYRNVEHAARRAAAAGLRFDVVAKENETIVDWLLRNGNVPVMPGGPHVCSLKFKGEVMQAWARRTYGPAAPIQWSVGIEATEDYRVARFTPARGGRQHFHYPLIALGLDRAGCRRVLEELGWRIDVRKSSCVFCPFMKAHEIEALYHDHPEAWALARRIEANFRAASGRKHRAWLAAGRPRRGADGRGPAPPGMWSRDAWARGARLFAATYRGRRLSVEEWEALLQSERLT